MKDWKGNMILDDVPDEAEMYVWRIEPSDDDPDDYYLIGDPDWAMSWAARCMQVAVEDVDPDDLDGRKEIEVFKLSLQKTTAGYMRQIEAAIED